MPHLFYVPPSPNCSVYGTEYNNAVVVKICGSYVNSVVSDIMAAQDTPADLILRDNLMSGMLQITMKIDTGDQC